MLTAALSELGARYRAVVSSLEEGIVVKDRHGRTLGHNVAAERILGVETEVLEAHVGLCPPLIAIDELGRSQAALELLAASTLESGQPLSRMIAGARRDDGSVVWLSINVRPVQHEGDPRPEAVVLSFTDITDRKLAAELLTQHKNFDALTGLPNRALFQRRIEEEVSGAAHDGRGLAVMVMDLDGFKVVNDTLGHGAGDQLLHVVAQRLCRCVRGEDAVARIGGDEFGIILGGVRDAAQVNAVADRVFAALAAPVDIRGQEIFAGASLGACVYPEGGATADAMIKNADSALSRAKEAGKKRCRVYTAEMSGGPDRLVLEAQLRRAIERDQLILHSQPKVTFHDGALSGFEVLVRWRHPERGLLMPGAFLRIAEESGLVVPMGRWVLQRACAQSAAWLRDGRGPARVAVNLSVRQLDDGGFVDEVARTLEETGLPARLLELEVTEGALMRDPNASARELSRLRALGVTIAVDDFGTGYSSLSYLQQLPIDALKVDRSFVSAMEATASTLPLVQAIVSMARALGLSVVAEGVETARQYELLRDLGCDEAQGYYIGRPVPAEDFATRWLTPVPGPANDVGPASRG
jgi:diguanylate cyclase (GGDEF)-like protein/PAS domain S-box-containing protein